MNCWRQDAIFGTDRKDERRQVGTWILVTEGRNSHEDHKLGTPNIQALEVTTTGDSRMLLVNIYRGPGSEPAKNGEPFRNLQCGRKIRGLNSQTTEFYAP